MTRVLQGQTSNLTPYPVAYTRMYRKAKAEPSITALGKPSGYLKERGHGLTNKTRGNLEIFICFVWA